MISDCYICGETEFSKRQGRVRDMPELEILECDNCGLVFLDSNDHISDGHYQNSGMFEGSPPDFEARLALNDEDDERRYRRLKSLVTGKSVLDFGCGVAGFLKKINLLASETAGVELESSVKNYLSNEIEIYDSLDQIDTDKRFDIITAFHVIEHLKDPRKMLTDMASHLDSMGRIVVEVPNSDDALLTLFECQSFQNFTYWSNHLYLFNSSNLSLLAKQAGLEVLAIEQVQRYTLANHLYWLSKGKGGGHMTWGFLDQPNLAEQYGEALAAIGKCDTIIAHLGSSRH